VHTYVLLLGDVEREHMRKRFAVQALASTLDGPPVFRFGNRLFYDLGLPPGTVVKTLEIPDFDLSPRCVPPMPRPSLTWMR